MLLPDDVLIQIIENPLGRRRRFPIKPVLRVDPLLLLAVRLAQHHEEMVALLALDEPGRADERLDVRARIAALGTRQGVLVLAARSARWRRRRRRGARSREVLRGRTGRRVAGRGRLEEEHAGGEEGFRGALLVVDRAEDAWNETGIQCEEWNIYF